jgi:hypothetical protein
MNYKKYFAEILNIDHKLIVGFTPKDSDHNNHSVDNMLLIIDPKNKDRNYVQNTMDTCAR